MGKRRVLSGSDVVALLASHGFAKIRQRGSHVVMRRRADRSTRSVIVPMHKELKGGTLSSIIRQSGLDRSAFES